MVLPLRPRASRHHHQSVGPGLTDNEAVLAPGSQRGRHPPGTSPTAVIIHDAAWQPFATPLSARSQPCGAGQTLSQGSVPAAVI